MIRPIKRLYTKLPDGAKAFLNLMVLIPVFLVLVSLLASSCSPKRVTQEKTITAINPDCTLPSFWNSREWCVVTYEDGTMGKQAKPLMVGQKVEISRYE